jgi:hypothetical protein
LLLKVAISCIISWLFFASLHLYKKSGLDFTSALINKVSSHCSKNGNRERGFSQECEFLLSCVIAFKKWTAYRTGSQVSISLNQYGSVFIRERITNKSIWNYIYFRT